MNNVVFIRPHEGQAAGLCNQLIMLINSLLYASTNKKQYVIVDNFINDIFQYSQIPFSKIIDINETNNFLKKYNVILKDKNFLDYPINNKFMNTQFENTKHLRVISYDIINKTNFFDIFKNIIFKSDFYKFGNQLISQVKMHYGNDMKINVIHARIEIDAIKHWSQLTNINILSYKNALIQKYLYLINKYIKKDIFTIVLCYNNDNGIVNYLKKNNYNYYIRPKNVSMGREINALFDFLLARNCNNYFIGAAASTFSEILSEIITCENKILLNLTNLNESERVFYTFSHLKRPF
jgi:hypothetical protein